MHQHHVARFRGAARPRVETSEAAAPAIIAAEKVRLLIMMSAPGARRLGCEALKSYREIK
jgi:hypothetical protein